MQISGFTEARQHLISSDETKNNGAVVGVIFNIAAKTPACKVIARLEKKTKIKPVENTSAFASKAGAIIASLLPNYTPVFFRNIIAVRSCPVLPGLGRHSQKETRTTCGYSLS